MEFWRADQPDLSAFIICWFAPTWTVAPEQRWFLAVYVIVIVSNPFLSTFLSTEPIFSSMDSSLFSSVLHSSASSASGARPIGSWSCAIHFFFCLHQITTIYSATMIGIWILFDLRHGRFQRAWWSTSVALASLACSLINGRWIKRRSFWSGLDFLAGIASSGPV